MCILEAVPNPATQRRDFCLKDPMKMAVRKSPILKRDIYCISVPTNNEASNICLARSRSSVGSVLQARSYDGEKQLRQYLSRDITLLTDP